MVALVTTACGLAIAVPLVLCSASITLRIRKMENLLTVGIARLLDSMKVIMAGSTHETANR